MNITGNTSGSPKDKDEKLETEEGEITNEEEAKKNKNEKAEEDEAKEEDNKSSIVNDTTELGG